MPAVKITCLHPALKDILSRESAHVPATDQRNRLNRILREMPDCELDQLIGIESTGQRVKRRSGEKRPPSAYNLFVRDCMKNRPEGRSASEQMSYCAGEWREQKRGRGL